MNTQKKVWTLLYGLYAIGILVSIFFVLREFKQTKKKADEIIYSYINTSDTILIKSSDVMNIEEQSDQIYFAPMLQKHNRSKNTVTFRNRADSKFYKLEFYSIFRPHISTISDTYIIVNKEYNKGKGMADEPIIVLNYFVDGTKSELDDEQYFKNVKEYLTYKDYTPLTSFEKVFLILFLVVLGIPIIIHIKRLK